MSRAHCDALRAATISDKALGDAGLAPIVDVLPRNRHLRVLDSDTAHTSCTSGHRRPGAPHCALNAGGEDAVLRTDRLLPGVRCGSRASTLQRTQRPRARAHSAVGYRTAWLRWLSHAALSACRWSTGASNGDLTLRRSPLLHSSCAAAAALRAALHAALCAGQSVSWCALRQYTTAWHAAHFLNCAGRAPPGPRSPPGRSSAARAGRFLPQKLPGLLLGCDIILQCRRPCGEFPACRCAAGASMPQ